MTRIHDYSTPEEGTVDWHVPLNENFESIEADVRSLANEAGTAVSEIDGYNRPEKGTVDWHIPLNENFESIEADIRSLATEANVDGVGGYNRPEEGTVDWHIPLNESFRDIQTDLSTIADAIGGTLSVTDMWYSLVDTDIDTGLTLYDATSFDGATLDRQIANTLDAMASETDGRALVWIPAGNYSWDQTIQFDSGSVLGPMFLFNTDARIEVTADWAFDFDAANEWTLVNDARTSVHVVGGQWTNRGTGTVRANDIYRGFFSPVRVTGGTHALLVTNGIGFCEGWTIRDAVFDGVDRPIRFDSGSADQQLLANLTFRDFQKAVHYKDSSGQNYTAAELRFENPRSDAVGMHFEIYTTGTIYHPVWTGNDGTVFQFDGTAIPSIVDADVADGASLHIGTDPKTSSGVSWQQGHTSPILSEGGPELGGAVRRTDAYSGTLPEQIEAAVADLTDRGAVIVPGTGTYSWDSTATLELDGREIDVLIPPNVRVDVSVNDWALNVTGDGRFGVYGGFWQGQRTSSQPGWLTTDIPNLNVTAKAITDFTHGSGIVASPRSKGTYRIFDTKLQNFGEFTSPGQEASVEIGGAGCSRLLVSHVETAFTSMCYRFDAPIDEFHGMRTSAHPNVDDATFADANAAINGTWFNPKWEAPGDANSVVFDNEDIDSPAAVVESWSWGNSEEVELWRGTKPQFFPEIDTRVSTAHVP